MVRRYQAGWAKAHIAKAIGGSRKCVQTWITRYETDGEAGLVDRSSRPHTTPSRTPRSLENQIVAWRRRHRCGPDEISAKLGCAPAQCHGCCADAGCPICVIATP